MSTSPFCLSRGSHILFIPEEHSRTVPCTLGFGRILESRFYCLLDLSIRYNPNEPGVRLVEDLWSQNMPKSLLEQNGDSDA